MNEKKLFKLFNAKSDGTINRAEHEELQDILRESAEARELWFLHQDVDAGLAGFVESPARALRTDENRVFRERWFIAGVAVAAVLAVVHCWRRGLADRLLLQNWPPLKMRPGKVRFPPNRDHN